MNILDKVLLRYKSLGPQRFRRVSGNHLMQVESEPSLVNQGLKQVHANNIVPFARKAAPVAA